MSRAQIAQAFADIEELKAFFDALPQRKDPAYKKLWGLMQKDSDTGTIKLIDVGASVEELSRVSKPFQGRGRMYISAFDYSNHKNIDMASPP